MQDVRVAILGASGWLGKVHTMAFQTFPQFMGTARGTARVAALVDAKPERAADLALRAPGARILTDWRAAVADPEIDLIDICLPDSLHTRWRRRRFWQASTSIAKSRWPTPPPRPASWLIWRAPRG